MDGPTEKKYLSIAFYAEYQRVDADAVCALMDRAEDFDHRARVISAGDGVVGGHAAWEIRFEYGPFQMSIIVHDASLPPMLLEHLRSLGLRDEEAAILDHHRSFAFLMATGGEGYSPLEKMIFLSKASFALCDLGALGYALPHSVLIHSKEYLKFLRAEFAEKEPGKPFWDSVRSEGTMRCLFAQFELASAKSIRAERLGDHVFLSRGFAFCGIPELLYFVRVEVIEEDLHVMRNFYDQYFGFCVANNSEFCAGSHINGSDGVRDFEFDAVPDGVRLFGDNCEALIVRKLR